MAGRPKGSIKADAWSRSTQRRRKGVAEGLPKTMPTRPRSRLAAQNLVEVVGPDVHLNDIPQRRLDSKVSRNNLREPIRSCGQPYPKNFDPLFRKALTWLPVNSSPNIVDAYRHADEF